MINAKSGRRGPRLLLAIALGGAAAAGVYLYVSSVQVNAQQTARAAAQQAATVAAATANRTRVVVAKTTLPAQTALTADNVELRDVPPDAVQPNAATSLGDIQGKALMVPVAAGQQILTHFIGNPDSPDIRKLADLVPVGKRAMSVTFSELSTAGGLVAPGDYIDVIAVFNKGTLGKDQSMILMQDVLVLAVAQATSIDQLPRQGTPTGTQPAQSAPTLPLPNRGGSPSIPVPQPTSVTVHFEPAGY